LLKGGVLMRKVGGKIVGRVKEIQREGKSWWFRTEVPIHIRMITALPRLKALGYDKVAFEGSTLAWGTDCLKTLKEYAPKYGVKVSLLFFSDY
jgi:ABC-type branched-subunit amino acid transport system substrate-binding protein